jgi:histidinol dehydrogenase
MQILTLNDPSYQQKLAAFDRNPEPDPALRRKVEGIMRDVAKNGDRALIRLTAKFGGPTLQSSQLFVTPADIQAARSLVSKDVLRAIRAAKKNVAAFARRGLRKSWFRKNAEGAIVGERFDPFDRVGIYVPGGTAPLVSTAVMTCSLAHAAGVREIVAATPAGSDGTVHPAVLAALAECGATEIYRVGGAQAIAALAHGTATIRPARKIFGPGNAYVVEAKRQVFGRVAVDLLPGPSEVLVIADMDANPAWVAADLLAQCEHGRGSTGILVTPFRKVLRAVEREISSQVKLSSRPEYLRQALENTALVEVRSLEDAVRLANAFAPEHTAIATSAPGEVAAGLSTSGAIFLGALSPVAAGDFLAGPSHELPTGGAGKSFAGLTADQFQRRTSILMFDEQSLEASHASVATLAGVEGLDAHARSIELRLERKPARGKRR